MRRRSAGTVSNAECDDEHAASSIAGRSVDAPEGALWRQHVDVYVYPAGAAPGVAPLAQGTLTRQGVANTFEVTIGGAPGLVAANQYVLAMGAPLQNVSQRQNGWPTPVQLANVNAGVYTFIA
jgi:hypothetical protein